jgi:hypothetical protein
VEGKTMSHTTINIHNIREITISDRDPSCYNNRRITLVDYEGGITEITIFESDDCVVTLPNDVNETKIQEGQG